MNSKFYTGDIVQFGTRGKVQYTVLSNSMGLSTVDIESKNTGKAQTVGADRLVLIQGGPARFEATEQAQTLDPAQIEKTTAEFVEATGLTGTVASPADEHTSRSETIAKAHDEYAANQDYLDTHPNTVMEDFVPEPLTGTVAPPKDEHTSYQKAILRALNVLGKHVYAGTAKNKTKRARAKLAKKARRNARKAKTARFLELSNADKS